MSYSRQRQNNVCKGTVTKGNTVFTEMRHVCDWITKCQDREWLLYVLYEELLKSSLLFHVCMWWQLHSVSRLHSNLQSCHGLAYTGKMWCEPHLLIITETWEKLCRLKQGLPVLICIFSYLLHYTSSCKKTCQIYKLSNTINYTDRSTYYLMVLYFYSILSGEFKWK